MGVQGSGRGNDPTNVLRDFSSNSVKEERHRGKPGRTGDEGWLDSAVLLEVVRSSDIPDVFYKKSDF